MHKSLTAALVITLGAGVALAQPAGVRPDLSAEDLERVRQVTAPTADFSAAENFEAMPAVAGTVRKLVNQDIFSFSLANLSFEQEERFKLGNALFRKTWVSSPSSTEASDGLGPLFNARGCQNCHLKDGRGHPPHGDGQESAVSKFLRLSVPAGNEAEQALLDSHRLAVIAEPTYGTQLQDFAVHGLRAEGQMRIDYADLPVTLGDGEVVTLRSPTIRSVILRTGRCRGRDALAAGDAADDRAGPPRAGAGRRHPCQGRPGGRRRRRPIGQAQPGAQPGNR